jgi:glucose/arabinose dehydrogenase
MSVTMRPMPAPRRTAVLLLVCVLAAACATPSPTPSATPAATPEPPTPTPDPPEPTPDSSPSGSGSIPHVSETPPPLGLETVAEGLLSPISLATAPGGWLLVNEQHGRVVAIHPGRGERAVVVDLDDRINGSGERGLLGLALHPDWPDTARAFIHYSANDGDAILAEFGGSQEGEGPPVIDAATERNLFELPDPYPNHNGGQLAFGPDGHLWVALGDGGSANDPEGHGQDTTTLLGSILRLDVSQLGVYAIPPDNPFTDGSAAPEIFLFGLRNPWRFSFDAATGLLWVADVGQGAVEEITRIDPTADAGANLGWNIMEGAHCFTDAACSTDGLVLPLTEYGHDLGCSVTGGFVYRGAAIPELTGWYLFADYCSGILFGIPSDAGPADGTALVPSVLLETGQTISSFGVDTDGELYLADHASGALSRIVAGGG